jgi:hypothetical protein
MLAFRRAPFFYARPIFLPPSLHRSVVFLARLMFWRLAGPAELLVENPPNVVGMIFHAEYTFDYLGYPRTGPQVGAIA